MIEEKTVVGIYSDSGLNGIEVSLIKTDGIDLYGEQKHLIRPYPAGLRKRIFDFILKGDYTQTLEMIAIDDALTDFHFSVYQEFYDMYKRQYPKIDMIGYSGHEVYHNTENRISISLGNPQKLADKTNIPVVSRFIQADLKSGGQGGPLFASFYNALTLQMDKPLGILSLGGITTLTCIGPLGELQAFDVGIGTALLDYWIRKHTGSEMDFDGIQAAKGTVDERVLKFLLKAKMFKRTPPKTVDKNKFIELYEQVSGCSVSDGAATLTAMVAHSIHKSKQFLMLQPKQWILVGGGIYNPILIRKIRQILPEKVVTAKEIGWENDTLNAQSYAFLSVRSVMGLPISFPQTTGVAEPVTGGRVFTPNNKYYENTKT